MVRGGKDNFEQIRSGPVIPGFVVYMIGGISGDGNQTSRSMSVGKMRRRMKWVKRTKNNELNLN
jgi:hypothetical protein